MLMTEKEVAALLKISAKAAQDWRCSGKGPLYVKLGAGPKAAVRYRLSDIEEFICANVVTSTSAQSARAVVPCWQLLKPQTKKTPAITRVNKAKAGAVKPGKSSKPTSESVAAELKRARAALDGEV